MKLLRTGPRGHETPVVSADGALGYRLPPGVDPLTKDGLRAARAVLDARPAAGRVDLAADRIGAPVRPGKIVCVGLNYRRHAQEAGMAVPDEPILFLKASDTVVGPHDEVVIPPGSLATDYELELAVVIGQRSAHLRGPAEARRSILGYAVANDVSERTFQLERGGTWDKGKNCETFCPIGPWLVTADEVPDVQTLSMRLEVNGETRQRSSTADMIVGVHDVVAYVSRFMTLYPGDVVLTGTPEGVGSGFTPARFLRPGDVITSRIDRLGEQRLPLTRTVEVAA